MARTIEQVRADIEKLREEEKELLSGRIRDLKITAVNALTELHDLGEMPTKIYEAVKAKDGTINLKRTFAIRG